MRAVSVVNLPSLMEITRGRKDILLGLIDGPVAVAHPELANAHIRDVSGRAQGTCLQRDSAACRHGTFIAGILSAQRSSAAPALCPDCTLLVRPIFAERTGGNRPIPSAEPDELAAALIDCVAAGAHVVNLSVELTHHSCRGHGALEDALEYAAGQGTIVVAAAGNQGTVGSSVITRHPWVIPVVACDLEGRPTDTSTLGSSVGRRGLRAPGHGITSLDSDGTLLAWDGTSVAAPFVTGTVALLWTAFPAARAVDVKAALTQRPIQRRATVVPPLLDAWAAYNALGAGLLTGSHMQ